MQDSLLQWFAQRFMDTRLSPRDLLFARKLVYIGLVLLLFIGSFFWRRYGVEPQASQLALLEQSRGEVELSGSLVRLTLTGSRGFATCALWMIAIEKQRKHQWNEVEFYVGALTRLQPHFTTPWLFQSWNLSYNVSVESDRPFDKYFYISRGLQLLAEGERQNQNIPEMRFYNGFYLQHKICVSDETNVLRSLFQLSLIPPSERDPARFRKTEVTDGVTRESINWEELEQFCREHPRLVRRLSEGIRRDDKREQFRQFVCVSATAMISFLEKNYRVPSRYKELPMTPRGAAWQKIDAEPLAGSGRFPVLPPRREVQPPQERFLPAPDYNELTDDVALNDAVDAQAVARAWYGYAQEPLPPPGDLPGSSELVTDSIRQRRPKQMATLLFRQYPALCQTHLCQNLQQEGWFDNTKWPVKSWFSQRTGASWPEITPLAGPTGFAMSQAQWADCARMWELHAKRNHMIFESLNQELNANRAAELYWKAHGMTRYSDPLLLADPSLTQEEAQLPLEERERLVKERERLLPDQKRKVLLDLFRAKLNTERRKDENGKYIEDFSELEQFNSALFLYELTLYRSISNFQHHYHAARVEERAETVKARRLFAEATLLRYQGSNDDALEKYLDPDALYGWRDRVLFWPEPDKDRVFREDQFIQEQTFETQLDYLILVDEKEQQYRQLILGRAGLISAAAQQLSLAPAGLFTPVPVDYALLNNLNQKLQGQTFFPRPFDVPVVNPDNQSSFLPLMVGMAGGASVDLTSPAQACVGLGLFSAGGTRGLISEGVMNTVRDRRREGQPQQAQPVKPEPATGTGPGPVQPMPKNP